MEEVNPTRMELLARRAQIMLAERGRELLKQKRNALWKELAKTMDVVLDESDQLEAHAAKARQALAAAESLDGREVVLSAAFAARRNVSLEVRGTNVMGVSMLEIEGKNLVRATTERGYSLASTSSRIDRAARRFEEELEMLIDLAASEMRLRRLVEEIRKTTQKVNSLEMNLLPRLKAQCAYIENVLNEHEREDLFRMKRIKKALGQRRSMNISK